MIFKNDAAAVNRGYKDGLNGRTDRCVENHHVEYEGAFIRGCQERQRRSLSASQRLKFKPIVQGVKTC